MVDINVALIGCGFVSSSHLAAWQKIPFAKVVAVCDPDTNAMERVKKSWRIPQGFSATSELKNCDEVNLWDICTPIPTHKDLAIEAMRSGFDVLIEKPLALNSKDAKEIVDCNKVTGRKACVIHNWLFEPPVLKARALIENGKIGEIIGAYISILHPKDEPMAANKDHWSHKLPGGRFSEMIVHPIYLLRQFMGEIEVVNVNVSKIGPHPWMKYDELLVNFRSDRKFAGVYVTFNAPRYSIFIDLFGSKGIIRLDIINATVNVLPSVKLRRLDKTIDSVRQSIQLLTSIIRNGFKILSKRWYDGHEMCIYLFAESLIKNTSPPVTLEEAYEVVKIVEKVYKQIEKST